MTVGKRNMNSNSKVVKAKSFNPIELFEIVLSYLLPHANSWIRLMTCTILAVFVWAINFYAVLSWLQPLLLGGRWIIDLIPWWVAAATHLVFGWTVALLYSVRPTRQMLARTM